MTDFCLNLGSGEDYRENSDEEEWINIDIKSKVNPDLLMDISQGFPFEDEKFDKILAKGVIEHIHYNNIEYVLKEIFRVLKRERICKIITPAFGKFIENKKYINNWKKLSWWLFGEGQNNSDRHKSIFTYKQLSKVLKEIGFEIESHEFTEHPNIIIKAKRY